MSNTTKKVLLFVIGAIVGYWILSFVVGTVLSLLFSVVIPVLVIAGIAYGVYRLMGRKALGGGRKTLP